MPTPTNYERLYDAEWKENQILLKAIEKKDMEYVDLSARFQRCISTADRRLELLKQIEWVHVDYIWFCPWCHSKKEEGHTDDCKLDKELRGD